MHITFLILWINALHYNPIKTIIPTLIRHQLVLSFVQVAKLILNEAINQAYMFDANHKMVKFSRGYKLISYLASRLYNIDKIV